MRYPLKIILLTVLMGCFIPAKAQLLTIKDATDQAIQNNGQINQMRSQLNQKKEALSKKGLKAEDIEELLSQIEEL